ncbi:ArsR/SmtB family transcription factor [Planctomicrobium sp. SH661]|uniref:ArsR/SmtB family transcription factor n=1 Tax=Planctomicrobium sp. SH661 TaxID=3448124 RepID=UPI003F5BA923
MSGKRGVPVQDPLSLKFAALADPTRRAMLARLAQGQASVSEIAAPFLERMSLPAVTKHLQVLERAGLLTKTQDAQRRLCDLNPEGFKETAELLELYRQMWEQRFDQLGAYLETVTARQKQSSHQKSKGKNSDGGKKSTK